jgi:hypothetical protein
VSFTRRTIPEAVQRDILQRLRRDGILELVCNVIMDHHDSLEQKLRDALARDLAVDGKQLAAFQAIQGASSETARVAAVLWALGEAEKPVQQKTRRRRDPLEARTLI